MIREQKTDDSFYRYGYQGQFSEKDEETGWNHFELREYNPIVGRWTSKDRYGQYWSPYSGMGNNPVSGIDPDGGYSKAGAWWRSGFGLRGKIYQSGFTEDGSREVWGFNTSDGVSHFGREDIGTFWNGLISEGNDAYVDLNYSEQGEVNNLPGYLLTGAGAAMTGAENRMFNDVSWYSLRKMKVYSQRFNGNQYTGGKLVAKKFATGLKWTGRGIGVYNAVNIELQYHNGQLSQFQRVTEQGSNLFSTFGGVYGAAWGVGWEAGRAITSTRGFRRWERHTWLPWRKENLGY